MFKTITNTETNAKTINLLLTKIKTKNNLKIYQKVKLKL